MQYKLIHGFNFRGYIFIYFVSFDYNYFFILKNKYNAPSRVDKVIETDNKTYGIYEVSDLYKEYINNYKVSVVEDIKVTKDIGKLTVSAHPLKVTTPSIFKNGGSISSNESLLTNASLNGLAKGDTLGEVSYISSISKKRKC